MQHVGHLIKEANMGHGFQWKSVLNYDAEYRKMLSEAGFAYSADSNFMMPQHLIDKPAHGPCLPKPQNSVQHPRQSLAPEVENASAVSLMPPIL